MKKYNLLYTKRTFWPCFGIASPLSLFFFIVALFADALEYDLYLGFFPLVMALLVWLTLLLRIPFANRLLKLQIKDWQVTFHDEDAKPLYPTSTKFLTDEWFIASGRLILHKKFIEKISIKKSGRKGNYDYYCVFKCKNQKQYRLFTGASEAKQIKAWFAQSHH